MPLSVTQTHSTGASLAFQAVLVTRSLVTNESLCAAGSATNEGIPGRVRASELAQALTHFDFSNSNTILAERSAVSPPACGQTSACVGVRGPPPPCHHRAQASGFESWCSRCWRRRAAGYSHRLPRGGKVLARERLIRVNALLGVECEHAAEQLQRRLGDGREPDPGRNAGYFLQGAD